MSVFELVREIEWISWSRETADERPDVAEAVARFQSLGIPAGEAAESWLRDEALAARGCRTYLLMHEGGVQGYYALTMSQVELSSNDRKKLELAFPYQGAALIPWLARAREPSIPDVAEHLLLHAVGMARRGAEHVGAAVIALDPYDDATAELWRRRGFKNSRTVPGEGKPPRMWRRLPD